MAVEISCVLKRIISYCKTDLILHLFHLSCIRSPLLFILVQPVQMSPHCHHSIRFFPICKMLFQKSNLKTVKKSFVFTAQISLPVPEGIKAPDHFPGFCLNLFQWKLFSLFLYQHTLIILPLRKLRRNIIAGSGKTSGQPVLIKSGFHLIPDIILIRCFIILSRNLFLFQRNPVSVPPGGKPVSERCQLSRFLTPYLKHRRPLLSISVFRKSGLNGPKQLKTTGNRLPLLHLKLIGKCIKILFLIPAAAPLRVLLIAGELRRFQNRSPVQISDSRNYKLNFSRNINSGSMIHSICYNQFRLLHPVILCIPGIVIR